MSNLVSVEQLQTEVAPIIQRANAITVRSADDRAQAMDFLKAVKGASKRASEFFAPIVESSHTAWKQATASRAAIIDPLDAAEKRVKATIVTYDGEETARRLAEERRLQAEADERARKEREKLERQAAKIKTPELREARLQEAASIVAPVITIAEPEKPKEEATRQRWKGMCLDLRAIVQDAASGNEDAMGLLAYNETSGNALAKIRKGNVTVKGWATRCVSELAVKV